MARLTCLWHLVDQHWDCQSYVVCPFCVNHHVHDHLYTSIFSIRSNVNHFCQWQKIWLSIYNCQIRQINFLIVTWNYFLFVIQNFQLLDSRWFNLHHWSNDWQKNIIAQKHLVANFKYQTSKEFVPWLQIFLVVLQNNFGHYSKKHLVVAQKISVVWLMVAQFPLVS